jgi:hypothetical protein
LHDARMKEVCIEAMAMAPPSMNPVVPVQYFLPEMVALQHAVYHKE